MVEGELAALQLWHDGHRLVVIQGGAKGADRMAREWCCRQPEIQMINEPADWKMHGRAAGPIRNKRMLDEYEPDMVLAFPGGAGTANMVKQARAAGVKVIEVGKD